jgi:hypothetical protein
MRRTDDNWSLIDSALIRARRAYVCIAGSLETVRCSIAGCLIPLQVLGSGSGRERERERQTEADVFQISKVRPVS